MENNNKDLTSLDDVNKYLAYCEEKISKDPTSTKAALDDAKEYLENCKKILSKEATLSEALDNAKNIDNKMYINELNNDITNLLLKYSDATNIQHLQVHELQTLSNFIVEIIKNPAILNN